jgi:homogentisate phytyltransferase/homogentisate geranylgeranyltransferase
MSKVQLFLAHLWQFTRPHTIIGTSLSVVSLYLVALAESQQLCRDCVFGTSSLGLLLGAWIACLGGNIYIVGLNQICDINIDRINKPNLPLAHGDLSVKQGWKIIFISGGIAITLSAILGPWLLATVGISLAIGTAYSLPPFRLKRLSFLAALCIITVRGAIVNLGLFSYFTQALVDRSVFPISLIILTLFILVFSIAIALFKDVPDTEGDQKYQIQTFTLTLGKATVFKLTIWIIALAYIGMILAGLWILPIINSQFFVGYHAILLVLLLWKSQAVNLESKRAIADFYQFIWKLFFLEYLLFPLALWLPA